MLGTPPTEHVSNVDGLRKKGIDKQTDIYNGNGRFKMQGQTTRKEWLDSLILQEHPEVKISSKQNPVIYFMRV